MGSGPVLTVLVLGGAAAGVMGHQPWSNLAALAIACLSLAGLDVPRRARVILLCGGVMAASAWDGAIARDRALLSSLQSWFHRFAPEDRAPETTLVRGTLAEDASEGDNGVRMVIDVESLRAEGVWRVAPGRIHAHVSGALASTGATAWTAGRRIAAPMMLREPQSWRNPGTPSDRWQMLHRTADLTGTIKSAALVAVEPAAWWDEAAAAMRRHVRDTAARYVAPHSAQSAAIVAAILIGDRAGLAEDVQRRLRAAGTYHVIAISGGNVAIVTSLCLILLRVAIRSFRAVAMTTAAVVLTYGWLVGNEPSVRRAVTAACVYLAVSLIGARPRAIHVVNLTAMIMALAEPLTVLDAGAWLSFGATYGIVIGAGRFMQWASGGPAVDRPRRSRAGAVLHAFWVGGLGLFSATLAAELTLLPVSAALFARVSPLGLVLNFVAIPAMTIVQLAGLAATGCAGWWDAAAKVSGRVADIAASWLVGSSQAVDAAPWLVWRVPPTPLIWTVMFYAGLGTAVWLRGSGRARRVGAAATAVSLVVIVTAPGIERAGPQAGRVRVTILDVGQGDAALVQFPDRHSLLIDAGGSGGAGASFDIGGRVVTPAVWALGVRHLDWLAVTHADLDHIGGALAVERDLRPREIWEGVPVPRNLELLALRRDAHDRQIAWRQVLAGHRLELGSVVLEAIHPPAPDWERQRVRNDDSLVFRLQCGAVEMLLAGDAGREFESRFSRGAAAPALRLLKVGHHGSRSSSSSGFVDAFRPQAAFISAGRGNAFGHPAPDVVARFERAGTTVFRTDRDGAITVETDGAVVEVSTMSGRRWTIATSRR